MSRNGQARECRSDKVFYGGGTNIEVLGGAYSCNGTDTIDPPVTGAGIYIDGTGGAATSVRIIGAALNNSVYDIHDGWLPATQDCGVYVKSGAATLMARYCDLSGNNNGAINAPPVAGASVEVTNCTGYNDQSGPLSAPPLSASFKNIDLGYYGPVVFYVWGGSGTGGLH
jgi:hypothetical protein